MNDVMDFLELSYYNGKFYGYKHGPLISFPTSSPCSVGYLNTAWPYRSEYNYGDLPSSMTSSDMDNIYNNMLVDALDNLLDLSTWGQYNATRYSYYVREGRTEKFWGPLFPILVGQYMFDYCYEIHPYNTYYLHLLSQEDLGYIYNDPILYDTVTIVSYEISRRNKFYNKIRSQFCNR